MPATVVVGAQWGDEGKAKVIDWLTATRPAIQAIVRYQGGANAGHTVVHDGKTYKFHLIPSGILDPSKLCIIGPGTVIMPEALEKELAMLVENGIAADKLLISERAHVTLPYHTQLDGLKESDFGDAKIGTTGRGIGPTYEDKVSRVGLRMGDLLLDEAPLKKRIAHILEQKNPLLTQRYGVAAYDVETVYDWCQRYRAQFGRYIANTDTLLWQLLDDNAALLLEGAQGTMLDLDYGTYPYVTSSNPTSAGAYIGSGLPPKAITEVIGIAKAYTTRVGEGPFPTELNDAVGEHLQRVGHEFGTTTGRSRRCGWLDVVALRYAARVNGLDSIALTKLDVLSGLDEIKLCVAYRNTKTGETLRDFPSQLGLLDDIEPVYQSYTGWQDNITACQSFEELPKTAQAYVQSIITESGVPISMISLGPERNATILMPCEGKQPVLA